MGDLAIFGVEVYILYVLGDGLLVDLELLIDGKIRCQEIKIHIWWTLSVVKASG